MASYIAVLAGAAAALLPTYWLWAYMSWYVGYRKFRRSHGCRPLRRAPQWDPFLGLDHFYRQAQAARRNKLLYYIQDWFRAVGPTFGVDLLGDYLIFTDEPQNIHAMLATKFSDFEIGAHRRNNAADLLGSGIIVSDGPAWKHGRALIRPNFTLKQLTDLRLVERHVQRLFHGFPDDGSSFDMQERIFRLTLDVGTDLLFERSSDLLLPDATEAAQKFAWAFDTSLEGVATRMRMAKAGRFYHHPEYLPACRFVHEYIEKVLDETAQLERQRQADRKAGEEAEDSADEPYSLVKELIRGGVDRVDIRYQVLNILVALRDTSACLMSAAVFELARRPDVQAKLRREVNETLEDGRHPTFKDLKSMVYLSRVVRETLRMYPPIPFNGRVAVRNTVLPRGGGPDGAAPIYVQKGQQVAYAVFSMHRRADLWGSDANEFRPERWETARPKFEYLPFSAGPRICPGQQFATIESSYFLVRLLQEYSSIESRDEGLPWMEKLTLTASIAQGVSVGLRR
ncbi:cytochrome P450 CYP584G1 [Thelonectria olida]|uniref:Cytochrome P450 CYP584G1 n=1 Tax=Thelonectria olida TaxID=1576542 RepID=A0A9P8VU86_9HYPO|nr:cytochrome P450 CYP584G1 [Thelonectria olida]